MALALGSLSAFSLAFDLSFPVKSHEFESALRDGEAIRRMRRRREDMEDKGIAIIY